MPTNPTAIANALALQNPSGQGLSVPGASPLVSSYNQWVSGQQVSAGLPKPMLDFIAGAFGPLSPITPMPIDVPVEEGGRAQPRRWQYPVGWNLPIGQPGTEAIKMVNFQALRRYADLYSVVRAMLNIRENETAGLSWDVGPTADAQAAVRDDPDRKNKSKDAHDRSAQIVKWFRKIDSNYKGFQSWFQAALEEQFVIDALALYIAPTLVKGKGLFGSDLAELQLIAGDTVRPLLDMRGSTPRPPAAAYQQYLWGVPRVDLSDVISGADLEQMAEERGLDLDNLDPDDEYRADQMLYLPRLKRAWTPYGFSPIEQAVMPITIGMSRQSFLLDYFTEGTIPGVYVIAGDQYVTPAQQRQLQDSLNALAGDIAWKHRVIVLPPGSKTDAQKDLSWQAQVDTNIVEQVAMVLHIQPHEIGMLPGGRSGGLGGSGQSHMQQEAVTAERTEPDRKWWKEAIFDWIIQRVFNQEDLEWKWVDFDEEEDEEKKSNARKADITIGRISIDETRIQDGLDPWDTPYTRGPIAIMAGQIVPLDPSVPPIPAAPAGPPGGDGSAAPDGTPLPPGHTMHTDGVHMLPPGHKAAPDGTVVDGLGNAVDPSKLPKAPTGNPPPNPYKDLANGKPSQTPPGQGGQPVTKPFGKPGKNGKKPGGGPVASTPASGGRGNSRGGRQSAVSVRSSGPSKAKKAKITVAELVKAKVQYKGDLTKIVYRYLLRSYPKDAVEWVKDGEWEYDPKVKLSDINMARRPGGRNPEKVDSISDTLDHGASMDPIVLVERQDQSEYKYDIADGWHRTLGAEKAGWDELPAFIGIGFDDKADWGLEMQDVSDSKKRAALAELAVLRRYLKKGNDIARFRTTAIDSDALYFVAQALPSGVDAAIEKGRAWIGKAGGNPEALREWYNEGADGQIDWGSPGDFDQCVAVASNYMDDDQAKGFCQLRHMDATGETTSEHAAEDKIAAVLKYSPDQERGPDGRWVGGGGETVGRQVGTMTTTDEEGYEHTSPVHETSDGRTVALHAASIGSDGRPLVSIVEEVRPHPLYAGGTGHWQGTGDAGTFEHARPSAGLPPGSGQGMMGPRKIEKYSPDQARVDAGSPDGGQFTSGGGGGGDNPFAHAASRGDREVGHSVGKPVMRWQTVDGATHKEPPKNEHARPVDACPDCHRTVHFTTADGKWHHDSIHLAAEPDLQKYSEDEARDERGRWAAGATSGAPGSFYRNGTRVIVTDGPRLGRTGTVVGRANERGEGDRNGSHHVVAFDSVGGTRRAGGGLYEPTALEPAANLRPSVIFRTIGVSAGLAPYDLAGAAPSPGSDTCPTCGARRGDDGRCLNGHDMPALKAYDPSEARDERGRWTIGGDGAPQPPEGYHVERHGDSIQIYHEDSPHWGNAPGITLHLAGTITPVIGYGPDQGYHAQPETVKPDPFGRPRDPRTAARSFTQGIDAAQYITNHHEENAHGAKKLEKYSDDQARADLTLLEAVEAELIRRGVDIAKYSPDQPRDERGRWAAVGSDALQTSGDSMGTKGKYFHDGAWDPSRADIHQAVMDEFYKNVTAPPDGQKIVYMTGGGFGSGKSTLLQKFPEVVGFPDKTQVPIADPDAAKQLIPEMAQRVAIGDRGAASYVHEESSDLAKEGVKDALAKGYSVIYDTSADTNPDSLERKVSGFRDNFGATKVVANYAFSGSIDESYARAQARAANADGTRRDLTYAQVANNSVEVSRTYLAAADRGIFDSQKLWSTAGPFGSPPTLIAETSGGQTVVHDQPMWDAFVEISKLGKQ